ncbi:MAG TPA: hypothetical protein VNT26_06140, partial [Candidatus Sulfotelmatobacter sp.]|nr:hypothetical protein [Candidatus Sulfotelmatobacter sp.]
WSTLLSPTAALPEWQQRFGSLMAQSNGVLPQAQKGIEEVISLLEQNSRTGSQLVQQAMAAVQTPNPVESQAKWMEFWMTSFGALRSNVQAATQLNTQALDAWLGLTRTATMQSWNPKTA